MSDDHVASWSSDTDTYSWDHPDLASNDPVLGEQTGWTHLTRWVAITVTFESGSISEKLRVF